MLMINGRQLAHNILDTVKNEVEQLSFRPVFCDVLVGNEPASLQYVQMKEKRAKAVGIDVHSAIYPETITTEELVSEIKKINALPNMCGLIVQLPLPESVDTEKVLDAIDPAIDVDVLGADNMKLFYAGAPRFIFPTALAVLESLRSISVDLKDKKILVIGKGKLVGRPVAFLLHQRGYDVVTMDQSTEDPDQLIKTADVIITAAGQGELIHGGNIKEGVIIIDAGTSESNGRITGDVDVVSVEEKASHVSPVPGGVGPLTIAMLFKNVLLASHSKKD